MIEKLFVIFHSSFHYFILCQGTMKIFDYYLDLGYVCQNGGSICKGSEQACGAYISGFTGELEPCGGGGVIRDLNGVALAAFSSYHRMESNAMSETIACPAR